MAKPIPPKETLLCPACRRDIGGSISLDDLKKVVKRLERRLVVAQMAIKRAETRKAVVMLRRLIMKETNLELNITDAGKRLGLRQLAEKITSVIIEMCYCENCRPIKGQDYKEAHIEITREIEKLIIDYFTKPDS